MLEAKRGDRVSLNLSKRSYYFQDGEFGLHLAMGGEDTAVINQKVTDEQLLQINHSVKLEQLIIGVAEKRAVVAVTDDEVKKVLELGRNKINDWLFNVRDDKKIKHEAKVAQIEKVISLEKEGKKRSSILDEAERILSFLGGVSPVQEDEKEKTKVEIKLT